MGGIGFEKIAKIILIAIIASMVLTVAFDLITILAYREEVRVQAYIGGFYVASMAADATELAKGETDPTKLYKVADVQEEFKKFAQASFGNMGISGSSGPDGTAQVGSTTFVKYDVGTVMLHDVIASCEILSGGVDIGVEYRVDPRINMILGGGHLSFPYYRVRTSRRFRILGQ